METSFVPAPAEHDCEGGKLLIVGGLYRNRNQIPALPSTGATACYKPAGLSNLSEELFQSFIRDLQLSMRSYWSIYWVILAWLFTIFGLVPLLVPPYHTWFYFAVCLAVTIFIGWRNSIQRKDLEDEMEARIKEWEPLFEKQGFQVEYIVDDNHAVRPTETYIHIHRLSGATPSSAKGADEGEEEAQYLLLFPRLFRRRNKLFRAVPVSTSKDRKFYAKPPSLHNLSDELFQELMNDLGWALRALMIKKLGVYLVFAIVWFVVHYLALGNEYVMMPLIALFVVLDQFYLDHRPFLSSPVTTKIEEWKPRLEANGSTIDYQVDQPSDGVFSWKEGYVRIRAQSNWTPGAA